MHSELTADRESAIVTVLAESRAGQAREWESVPVEKRNGFRGA